MHGRQVAADGTRLTAHGGQRAEERGGREEHRKQVAADGTRLTAHGTQHTAAKEQLNGEGGKSDREKSIGSRQPGREGLGRAG